MSLNFFFVETSSFGRVRQQVGFVKSNVRIRSLIMAQYGYVSRPETGYEIPFSFHQLVRSFAKKPKWTTIA